MAYYRAKSLVLESSWDAEHVFRKYQEGRCWERSM